MIFYLFSKRGNANVEHVRKARFEWLLKIYYNYSHSMVLGGFEEIS